MSTVFSRFSEGVVVLEVDVVIGNKGDATCESAASALAILSLCCSRRRGKEEKKGNGAPKTERKEGREEGRRFMTVLICESSLWHLSDDFALYISFVPHRAKYLLRTLHAEF